MSSHLADLPRRVPTQDRGERRVAALLDAAASVISDVGYESATMSDIADRAGACIGSLYQFFPNKLSMVRALRTCYGKQFQELWAPLRSEAPCLSLEALVGRLVDSTVEFIECHRAFLPLLDAPAGSGTSPTLRMLREHVASIYLARRPRMSKDKAYRLAAVTLQIIKALNQLYAAVHPHERTKYVQEFKMVLLSYLTLRLEPRSPLGRTGR